MSNLTELLSTCQFNVTSLTQSLTTCSADLMSFQINQTDVMTQLDNCTTALAAFAGASDGGETEDSSTGPYNKGLHIAAVFIIFAASTLGTVLPLLSRYHPKLSIDPYYIILGKCGGIGIILACALIHMIQPANEALTDQVLGPAFTDDYPAYAFLYAMLGALAMHFLDFVLEFYITKHLMEQRATEYQREPSPHPQVELTSTMDKSNDEAKKGEDCTCDPTPSITFHRNSQQIVVVTDETNTTIATPEKSMSKHQYFENPVDHAHAGHAHGALLLSSQRTLSAYLLEFGVTVHSVFIGLENGVVPESQLKKLLVALCFHQFFEGVALGARIHDAHLANVWHEVWMTLAFAISAPLGIAIGIGVVDSLDPEGNSYLLTQGTLDGVCGGILLYIGFNLLLRDFQEDMKRFVVGHKYAHYRRMGMFAAMWLGAAMMAFIGKYL